MKKSLLVFSQTLPYPLVSGGKIRYHHLIRHLAERFDVHLLSLTQGTEAQASIEFLRTICREVRVVDYHRQRPSRSRRFKNILSVHPADLNYEDAGVTEEFSHMIEARRIDGVFIFSSFLASFVRLVPPRIRRVLDFDDVQWMRMKRMVEALPWGKKKVGYLIEPLKTKRFEGLILRQFDLAFACSDVDRRKVLELGAGVPVEVVPNGVDPERFDPKAFREWAHPSLVYTGGLGSQGGEGVLRFMEEIYPLIREEVPEIRLHLVGGEILPEVQRAAKQDSSVELEGMVDDVRPSMAGGWVFVVPLWVGSGTRVKILEACAMQRAVVSTPVGAEGLDFAPGHHLFVEETPERFAARCVELLRNRELRREIGRRAREVASSRYHWSKIGRRAADLLEELMG